jgi:hypothetical protein
VERTRQDTARDVAAPARRVVLIGASNLTKGFGTVLDATTAIWGARLEVLVASGHGRSYGAQTRVIVRELPGILQCGLWPHLDRLPPAPTAALVTDIGNDLLYEQPVDRIAGWVEECLDRLAARGAQTIVTLLPLENLPNLSRAKFHFFRALFVPRSRLSLEAAIERASQLDQHVERLAAERGFVTVRPRRDWYAVDPIHIHFAAQRRAWGEILDSWRGCRATARPRGAAFRTLYLRTRKPHFRRVCGIEQRTTQPAVRLKTGTTVAIF